MIEAMWAVNFATTAGAFGNGVVVFETGKIFGGDSMYYYTGNYTVSGHAINANVKVKHYAGPKQNIMGMGIDELNLKTSGQIQNTTSASAQGTDPRFPGQPISMTFRKLADLP